MTLFQSAVGTILASQQLSSDFDIIYQIHYVNDVYTLRSLFSFSKSRLQKRYFLSRKRLKQVSQRRCRTLTYPKLSTHGNSNMQRLTHCFNISYRSYIPIMKQVSIQHYNCHIRFLSRYFMFWLIQNYFGYVWKVHLEQSVYLKQSVITIHAF